MNLLWGGKSAQNFAGGSVAAPPVLRTCDPPARPVSPLMGLFFLLFLLGGTAFSLSLEELIGEERGAELRDHGTITGVQLRNPEPRLLPRHGEVRRLVEDARSALEPGILVETLFLYEKPAGAALPVWSEAERTGLFNGALALSTLTGIQYYSSSRKTMRTFYESSAVIDGPDTKRPQPDPVYGAPPAELTVYARQRDLTFGDNLYRYDYFAREDALIFVQQNLSALAYGIIPAVGRNKLQSFVAVIDAGEHLLIYAASMAKAASVPGVGQRIGNSFSTRAEAILGWFARQADGVFETIRMSAGGGEGPPFPITRHTPLVRTFTALGFR